MEFLNDKIKTIHFVGIGGISMSGLAEVMLHWKKNVTGSDIQSSLIIDRLKEKGAIINIPHKAENVLDADLLVYSSAIKNDNPEMEKARELQIPIIDRASFLGAIMKEYTYSIAVAGCHGKTSTTSIISLILKNAELDPTILLGGELEAIDGNVRIGKSPYFITEACEYMENFLKFNPYLGIILNIGEDHLDYFKDIEHIKRAYLKFAKLIPREGCLVLCSEDRHSMDFITKLDCNILTFGIDEKADYKAINIEYDDYAHPSFEILAKGKSLDRFKLLVPGRHNILNALSSVAAADFLGIDKETIKSSLLEYKGTHRRFEVIGKANDISVIDDYAHHPTEIKATLNAVKKIPHKKIWAIFQPHTYTRTITLLKEFSQSFNDADMVIITDIYAAREKDTGIIHSKNLADKIMEHNPNTIYMKEFEDIANHLAENAKKNDIIMTLGAGTITNLAPMIFEKLKS